ncbi:endonuclease/exonuclease/phosphatase family protein [Candidatus Daviesbacteria bacterium]|nr:endonuclease/exonuclease/phosphatase family protein [Candidatus Daviesbacteria bacterium]
MKLKILSWNIWKGKYLDQVIEVLKKENADILGLQEVIEKDEEDLNLQSGIGRLNLAEIIASKLGYQKVWYKAFTTDRHTPIFDIGNALLSKYPILESKCIFLSGLDLYQKSPETEPRIAIKAKIDINGKILNVITTHLGWSENQQASKIRELQVEKLLQLIKEESTILMGDFNSLPDSPEVKKIEIVLVNTDPNPIEPSATDFKADFRIDYIFVSKDLKFSNFRMIDSDASDHKPLVVEIDIDNLG